MVQRYALSPFEKIKPPPWSLSVGLTIPIQDICWTITNVVTQQKDKRTALYQVKNPSFETGMLFIHPTAIRDIHNKQVKGQLYKGNYKDITFKSMDFSTLRTQLNPIAILIDKLNNLPQVPSLQFNHLKTLNEQLCLNWFEAEWRQQSQSSQTENKKIFVSGNIPE